MRLFQQPHHFQNAFLQFSGSIAPDVAPSGMARLWYDSANSQLKVSVNGGSFGSLLGALRMQDLTAPHTIPTAPTADTTALLTLGAGTFSGVSAGTYLGIAHNAASYSGDWFHAKTSDGTTRFRVTGAGRILTPNNLSMTSDSALIELGAAADTTLQRTAAAELTLTGGLKATTINYLGSQTAGTGLVVGKQSGGLSGLGSNVGLDLYGNGNSTLAAFNFLNENTGTSAGLQQQFSFADTASVMKRAARFTVTKQGGWTNGSASTFDSRLDIETILNDVVGPRIRMDEDGRVTTAALNAAPADANLFNSSINWWIDEATPAVKARIRKSDGTYLTLTITNAANPTLS